MEWVLEGKIGIQSGKLVIIDPVYISGFNDEVFREKFEQPFNNYFSERGKLSCQLGDVINDLLRIHLQRTDLLLEKKPDRQEILRFGAEIKKANKQNKELRQRLAQLDRDFIESKKSPPYLLQNQQYVAFTNDRGEGHYPVVKFRRGFRVVFNYSVKQVREWPMERTVIDTSRLEGTLIDYPTLCASGMQIVADRKNVRIQKTTPRVIYCVIDVPAGKYTCRFIKNNEMLSIQGVS